MILIQEIQLSTILVLYQQKLNLFEIVMLRECVLWEFLVKFKVEHSLMLEIYCKEIRKKKRKKEKIRERMMLKCDATVLCKIFSENLRNQNRKTFISVFAYFLSVYAKSLFQWRGLGTRLLHHVVLRFCQHFLIS